MQTLSKTKYLIGLECPKHLWISIHQSDKIPPLDNASQHNVDVGNQIGVMATTFFPNGIDLKDSSKDKAPKDTLKALSKRKPLFEATFITDCPKTNSEIKLYSRADILNPVGKDEWDIIEVKSATRVKDYNIQDVSFQKYVYEKAGLKIRNCYIMHINNEYVRKGKIEPKELFTQTDITQEVNSAIGGIEDRINNMVEIIESEKCPEMKCSDLLNKIHGNMVFDEFKDNLPEENVFELYRISKKKAVELHEQGIKCIKDLPEDLKLTTKQKIQRVCALENKKHADLNKIKQFLDCLEYPLYYLDFETINCTLPKFDNTRPYEQIPFQYSLHIVEKPGEKPKHVSFLAEGTKDPRKEFMQSLKDNLGGTGSIIVYNQSFEKRIIMSCTKTLPLFTEWSEKIMERIVDLLKPFQEFNYYNPKQKGSASIKNVLPVMSDLSYNELDISNGKDASLEFERVTYNDVPDEERKKVRDALEKYCELDTLAEVLIVDGLREVVWANEEGCERI